MIKSRLPGVIIAYQESTGFVLPRLQLSSLLFLLFVFVRVCSLLRSCQSQRRAAKFIKRNNILLPPAAVPPKNIRNLRQTLIRRERIVSFVKSNHFLAS